MMSMLGSGMSLQSEAITLCDSAISSLSEVYRLLAEVEIDYAQDMLFDAICTVEQVADDIVIKGLADDR